MSEVGVEVVVSHCSYPPPDPPSVHDEHCLSCYSLHCHQVSCPLTPCVHCRIPLHECKQADHVEICTRAVVECLNAFSGCSSRIRRDLIWRHLPHCPAYNVVCGKERARGCSGKVCKKALKAIGKRREEKEWRCPPSTENLPVDLAIARFDQERVVDYYTYSRADRVRRRDKLNLHEACLPLRSIMDEHGVVNEPAPSQDVDKDSSDEEHAVETAKIAKMTAMFSQCYMCQVSPATQHFHTLGRRDIRWDDLMKKRKRRSFAVERSPFFVDNSLFVRLHSDFIGEMNVRSDALFKKLGTTYFQRCLCTVPRSSFGDHVISQHAEGGAIVDDVVSRCPLWREGCSWNTERRRVKGSKWRFLSELAAFTARPTTDYEPAPPSDGSTLESLPEWALEELSAFLPGVALASLSMASKALREKLFLTLVDRAMVTVRWEKEGKMKWSPSPSFVYSFPITETPFQWELNPEAGAELSSHLSSCPFYEKCPLPSFARGSGPSLLVQCLPEPPFTAINEIARAGVIRDMRANYNGFFFGPPAPPPTNF